MKKIAQYIFMKEVIMKKADIDNHRPINRKHVSWLSGTVTYRKVSYCQKGNITKETKLENVTQFQI